MEYAREIEARRTGVYRATQEELRTLDDAERSGVATEEEVEAAFRTSARMKVEYSNRAIADLHKISADSRRSYGDRTAGAWASHSRRHRSDQHGPAQRTRGRTATWHARGAAHSLSVQSLLPCARRPGPNFAHQAHRTAAMARRRVR